MHKIKNLVKKYRLKAFTGLFWFVVITFTIHFFWRLWAYHLYFWPIKHLIKDTGHMLADIVFVQSKWFIIHILGTDITVNGNTMFFPNYGYITVNTGCSGLKPILQFVLLLIFIPGPWKRKLWFIPVGVVIVHLTNLFRIIGLSVVTMEWPEHWHFSHDWIFRPFFYLVIFLMWVLWVEVVAKKKIDEEK